MKVEEYFDRIYDKVKLDYEVARKARALGIDPVANVEIALATSLAERAVSLISSLYPQVNDRRIVKRILDLEKEKGLLNPAIALKIAEEIAKEKFCKFASHIQAIEAGARVGIAYLTLGVVSSSIEGFVSLNLGKTKKGEEYFVPYYSGPIRSAGGTEAAFSLVILDYLREMFGYAKYDPTEEEIKRGVHESYLYHERVTNLQYLPTEEEIEFLLYHIPIQISGDPSEEVEVFNYKDLERVQTNFIRSGFCLVLNEGLAQKAPKILKRIKKLREDGFVLSDWGWLEDFVKFQSELKNAKKQGSSTSAVYIKDLVAGRPVFGHPSRSGSFRLRYGRCRNTGYSALGLNPATMQLCDEFIAIGTQLKIEKPTKGCTVASCTTIDGPIVKLKNGSVKKINEFREAERICEEVEEIIYLGDLLVPFGDYSNRNSNLDKPAYVEQYWLAELKGKGGHGPLFPDFEEAIEISKKFKIPLHPKYIYFWKEIKKEDILVLLDWFANGVIKEGKLILPFSQSQRKIFSEAKRALELLGCEHLVGIENVVLDKENTRAILFNLGINIKTNEVEIKIKNLVDKVVSKVKEIEEDNGLDIVNFLCEFKIRDKSGTFIGARMGRPEKSKLRKLVGSPNVLYPVGREGGRLRSFQAALEVGSVSAEFPIYFCDNCKEERIYPSCEECGKICRRVFYCVKCDRNYDKKCEEHNFGESYREKRIEIKSYYEKARKILSLNNGEVNLVKGVRGVSNEKRCVENLAKGLLRAKYNLSVNKDGTIRYDMSEMPLTHFKPREIGTTVEKIRELGYDKDIFGNDLTSEDQLLEIFPHDVILPASPSSLDEKADDVFLRISKFVDEELEKIYKIDKFYNANKKEDLIGQLLACIAPHNCAAVVGRLIGFSKTQVMLASPYMHAAMRRDCDGDEAAVMLLMDALLNFSKEYLPAHRGGTQDAPLVINARIKAGEVDDMIFDFDVSKEIPLYFYNAAEEEKNPNEVEMEQIKKRIGKGKEFEEIWFSYDTEDINLGPLCSSYKTLPTMQDKVSRQMSLCKKIRAVDEGDVARLIIERHFVRDIRGNLRKFSQQGFRCVNCNTKFRRPPLIGKCTDCGGKIIFTITEGSIIKYLQAALDLARNYNVGDYLLESLELTEMYIYSIFGKEKEKQEVLKKWF